ncbi:hypothetical protein HDU86_000738 [Geranomyces michiganensis]|nr:hypothetical protein HDU86_000738 [Geranomyces michiganensis]
MFINEVLEAIRFRALPSAMTNDSPAQGTMVPEDELARNLTISVFSILEFADTSFYITAENMKIVARYSGQLPKSWFMTDLLNACINVGRQADVLPEGSAAHALSSSLQILAAWLRKAGPAGNAKVANDAIVLADRTIRRASRGGVVEEAAVVACLVAFCSCIGTLEIETDLMALEDLCIGLSRVNSLGASGQQAVYSQLANLMMTLPPAPLKVVSSALLQSQDPTHGLEAHIRLMYLYEYIALAGYDNDVFAAGQAQSNRAKWWAFWRSSMVPKEDPFASLENLIVSIDELWTLSPPNSGLRATALMADAGIMRHAETKEKALKIPEKMLTIEHELRTTLLVRLAELGATMATAPPSAARDDICQIITFSSAQTLVSVSEEELISSRLDWQPVLSILGEVLLTHSEALYVEDDLLARVAEESFDMARKASADNTLSTRLHAKVSKGTQHPLYMEIGKIARIMGSLLAVQWTKGNYEGVSQILQRISGFCDKTHENWNLVEHPITEERFKTWHDSLQGLAIWIEERDAERQSEGAFVAEMLAVITPTYRGIFVHPNALLKSRLMFYLIISRLLLRSLSSSYVADDILPRLYPYLTYNVAVPSYSLTAEDKDLFELSHAVSITLFEHAGKFASLVAEFSGWYATVLIERFPEPIDFDLFRQSFSTMIKSLSTIKPSNSLVKDTEDDYDDGFADPDEDQKAARLPRSGRDAEHAEDMLPAPTRRSGDRDAGHGAALNTNGDDMHDLARAERTAEGDFIAWMCIARLADAIHRLSIQIDASGKSAALSETAATTATRDHAFPDTPPRPPSSSQSRLERILAASPTTALFARRDQIVIVLFDQISTIGLPGLEPLLATVRHIMLGGPVGYSVPFAYNDDDSDAGSIGPTEELASVPGAGTQTNPDRLPLWQSLFDAVAHYRGFDYTRRERCAQWYLDTLSEARRVWKERTPPNRPPEAMAPIHPELRAKL